MREYFLPINPLATARHFIAWSAKTVAE